MESDLKDVSSAILLVIKTRPRQEDRALENLERQGFEVYLPKIPVPKRLRGLWSQVIEPLFPGYLFLHANPNQVSLSPVRSTFGVSGLVRFGQRIAPVPDDIIDYLRAREREGADGNILEELPFSPGDKVDVVTGSFAGLSAIYQMAKGADRALVLVSMLGRQNSVMVPIHDIAPVV
jgi:transcriptional antiterminator RfaH